MKERIVTNGSTKETTVVNENLNYFTFFEDAPIAIWVEDFSEAKNEVSKIIAKKNTTINNLITENPEIIVELVSLVKVKDVNSKAVELYKAKNKKDLLGNLNKVFTEKSNEGFSNLLINILKGQTEGEIESINKTLDGKEFNILIKLKVAKGSELTLENIIVSIEDITERVKIRNKLADSEIRNKESQSIAKLGSWFYNYKTNKTQWSDEAYKIVGLESQSVEPSLELYLSFIYEEDKEKVSNFSIEYLLKNTSQQLNYRIITKNNELKYISEKRNVQVENNRVISVIGTAQDITERVLFEEKLNITKNLLSDTISSIKSGFVLLDANSNYTYINNEAAELLGKSVQYLIGKNIWEEFPEKEGDLFYDSYQEVIRTKKAVSFENYFAPWNRWFENRIIPTDNGVMMFFHEITEKKQNENRIKEAYKIINKSSSVAILCENAIDFPVIFASENCIELFEYGYEEFLSGKIKIHETVYPDDLGPIRDKVFELVKSKDQTTIKFKPFRIITKTKIIKWVKANIDVIRNESGKITNVQGIAEDITDQKRTEDLFFKSNQQLKHQFNNTPLASIIWDVDFNILEWNNSAERIFGYTAEEVQGKPNRDLLTPPHLLEEMKRLRETSFIQNDSFRQTNENITKNGEIIICDWYSVTLKDSKNNIIGAACLVDDITERIKARKLLEKSEKKYKDIFEKSIDSVLILKNGFFVDCNEATLKMFGYNAKESVLKLHPSQISPEFQSNGNMSFDEAEKAMKIALERGSNRFRWEHKRQNGDVFLAEVTLTKIEDTVNSVTIHTVITDISDRVKKELLENVLYNISKAASSIDDFNEFSLYIKNELHKIIDTTNFYIGLYDEATDMIKLPIMVDETEEVIEFPAEKSLSSYVIKTNKPLMVNNLEHKKLIDKGLVDLVGEESKIWVGVPLKIQGKAIGIIAVQSYNNEKAYHQDDLQLLEFVADQISSSIQRKDIEAELRKALIKAQESDKLKSSFLANMSHEIRTPMNGIIGFSELSLNPNLSEFDRKRYANIVVNSSKQLLTIVNDILDISKIEAGVVKLNYESTCLNHLMDDLYDFYKQTASDNYLKLICKKGLDSRKSIIEIDGPKLNQVLINLLSNSFKFTENGSIEFGYEMKDDSTLLFFVKDTGIGIDKEFQSVIFDRFMQAEMSLKKQSKGTGLGLAITKKFIELFHGQIWLESDENGTSVYFTIPYTKSNEKPITTVIDTKIKETPIEDMSLKILLAEDEEYNMLYMTELFSNTDIKIIEAYNGKEAIELAQTHDDIELILMDIKMPVMSGIEALGIIKKSKPKIPIIALSAFAMESDKVSALKNGFDDYLSKPIDRKKLFALIGKYASKDN